ncbi:MAG: DUF4398 domain-containing protein [Candidatus Methanofastidiosia archaeon]
MRVLTILILALLLIPYPEMRAQSEKVLFVGKRFSELENILAQYYFLEHEENLPEDLSSYKVLVVSYPNSLFSDEMISKVSNFVEEGGGLALIADENNLSGSTLRLNTLSEHFGIKFNWDRIFDESNFEEEKHWIPITQFPNHMVFRYLESLLYTTGCSLEGVGIILEGSEEAYSQRYDGVIVHQKGDLPKFMLLRDYFKGRLFAIGSVSMFGTHLKKRDNTLFALQLFDWLSHNDSRISQRQNLKNQALNLISNVSEKLEIEKSKGLNDTSEIEVLLSVAKREHEKMHYTESLNYAIEAQQKLEDKRSEIENLIAERFSEAQSNLDQAVSMGAENLAPTKTETARYYLRRAREENNYISILDFIQKSEEMSSQIVSEMSQRTQLEIERAEGLLEEAQKTFFFKDYLSQSKASLVAAKESQGMRRYDLAIIKAMESQGFSQKAVEEFEKIRMAGILFSVFVILILIVSILRRRK